MFRYLKPLKLICLRIVIFQETNPHWFLTVIHLVPEACRQCRRLFSTLVQDYEGGACLKSKQVVVVDYSEKIQDAVIDNSAR